MSEKIINLPVILSEKPLKIVQSRVCMLFAFFLFFLSLAALVGGAKLFVNSASHVARVCKISPLIIGLTIVAFGTSAPELVVCTLASWRGKADFLMGDVVGSNIFNILFALGLCATISPLTVHRKLIRWDVPLLIGCSFLLWFLAMSGVITRIEGAVFVLGIIAYVFFSFRMKKVAPPVSLPKKSLWLEFFYLLIGLILLTVGADRFIFSSLKIAYFFGVSELFAGLTLAAIGTSLPELTTSLVALFKGEKEMAVGNIIGSNLFNTLAVIGLSALVAPGGIEITKKALSFDLPILVGVTIATLPIFLTGHKISRWEGVLFLFYYVLYFTFLVLRAQENLMLPLFSTAFLLFILPLTTITIIVSLVRHFRSRVQ